VSGRPISAEGAPLEVSLADDRYDRLRRIPWWEHDIVRGATILVVGAGALGNELIKNLALLGVGRLLICDRDQVEPSNLSRAVLFRADDAGADKAAVAARAAHALNPDVCALPLVGDIRHDIGLGLLHAVDLVLGGLDNREARLWVNAGCQKVGRPWVDGAIEAFTGVARVFLPDGPCYECTMSARDYELLSQRQSCSLFARAALLEGKIPTTPTTAAVIAGIQCQEAIKLLHGGLELPTLAGRGFFFNGLTHDSFVVTYARNPACLGHDRYAAIEEMPWSAATTTVGEVVTMVAACLGPEAVVELEREVVSALLCDRCQTDTAVWQALSQVTTAMAPCPTCGAERWPRLTHTLPTTPDMAARPLASLGIPPWDILTGRRGLTRRHFELSGDRAAVLGECG
jgi:molybdopterin/thiamine biosynthesis adenylyltransferase